jgi:hypothetical protein
MANITTTGSMKTIDSRRRLLQQKEIRRVYVDQAQHIVQSRSMAMQQIPAHNSHSVFNFLTNAIGPQLCLRSIMRTVYSLRAATQEHMGRLCRNFYRAGGFCLIVGTNLGRIQRWKHSKWNRHDPVRQPHNLR